MRRLVNALIAKVLFGYFQLWRSLNPARHRWVPRSAWFRLQPTALAAVMNMGRYSPTGVAEVWFGTTVANVAAPTTAELNAFTDITEFCRVLPTTPRALNTVDISNLSSKTNFNQVGSRGGDTLQVEVLRDDATDDAVTTLAEDTNGYIAISRAGNATKGTWAVSDLVDLYPVAVGAQEDQSPGRDEADTTNIFLVQTAEANKRYALAT